MKHFLVPISLWRGVFISSSCSCSQVGLVRISGPKNTKQEYFSLMLIPWEAEFPEMGPYVQLNLIGNIPFVINLEQNTKVLPYCRKSLFGIWNRVSKYIFLNYVFISINKTHSFIPEEFFFFQILGFRLGGREDHIILVSTFKNENSVYVMQFRKLRCGSVFSIH